VHFWQEHTDILFLLFVRSAGELAVEISRSFNKRRLIFVYEEC
jgi:hypothetical protein